MSFLINPLILLAAGPVQYMPDTGWDNSGAWTSNGASDVNSTVASALHIVSRGGNVTGAAAALIVPGTYRYTDHLIRQSSVRSTNDGIRVTVGGTLVTAYTDWTGASIDVTVDIVVTTVSNQNIIVGSANQNLRNLWDATGGQLFKIA